MKKIAVLGSTGSIGTQTLDVVRNSGKFRISALSADKNIKLLELQIREFRPAAAAVFNERAALELRNNIRDTDTRVYAGMEGLCRVAAECEADTVVTSMVGSIGILPTLEAVNSGKNIALANKETMVCAGDIVNEAARKKGVKIIPVDSEHSAIFQCIDGKENFVKKIYLTASGGPFFGKKQHELFEVDAKNALMHPNWSMGKKITIDCATLINKGLEVIEAVRLFGVLPEQIKVLIHRQSVIHSMVEFCDNAVLAQLGAPDMKVPISYALSYPERHDNPSEVVDFKKWNCLTFEQPDTDTFRGLALGFDAIREGGTMPVVYSSANEAAVELFLKGKIRFLDIAGIVADTMKKHKKVINPTLKCIIETDEWAQNAARDEGLRTYGR